MALLWLCGSGMAAPLPAPEGGSLDFAIIRKGDVIGEYHSQFTRAKDGQTQVTIRIRAEVTLGPIRLYHFDQSSTELWHDSRLVALTSDADDDGEIHHLSAREDRGDLELTVDGKASKIPAESVPTSLWARDMVEESRPIFDSTDGQLFKHQSQCDPTPSRTEGPPGVSCQISGDLNRTLRYGADGLLDGMTFAADDGSMVRYRRH